MRLESNNQKHTCNISYFKNLKCYNWKETLNFASDKKTFNTLSLWFIYRFVVTKSNAFTSHRTACYQEWQNINEINKVVLAHGNVIRFHHGKVKPVRTQSLFLPMLRGSWSWVFTGIDFNLLSSKHNERLVSLFWKATDCHAEGPVSCNLSVLVSRRRNSHKE